MFGKLDIIEMAHSNKTLEERFWSYVNKDGPICEALGTKCWVWVGATDDNGYGNFRDGMKQVKAHRFSFHLFYGYIDENLFMLHKCDNPPCINPDHLWQGTTTDNMQDASRKGRLCHGVAHVNYGHPEKSWFAKITWNQVDEIREKYASGNFLQGELAEIYKIAPCSVSQIVNFRVWVRKGILNREGLISDAKIHIKRGIRYKLSWDQIDEIREKYASGMFYQTELAKIYKTPKCSINAIVNNRMRVRE